jgi:hypothetical protein
LPAAPPTAAHALEIVGINEARPHKVFFRVIKPPSALRASTEFQVGACPNAAQQAIS